MDETPKLLVDNLTRDEKPKVLVVDISTLDGNLKLLAVYS